MTKLLVTISMILYLVCSAEAQQQADTPISKIDYEVIVYPEEIYFGDPVYIFVRLKNISAEVVARRLYREPEEESGPFWLSLFSNNISVPYHLLWEHVCPSRSSSRLVFPFYNLQPGESMLISDAYRELPALEDMNFLFWEEAKKRLSVGETIIAYVGVEKSYRSSVQQGPKYEYVSGSILVKPRPGDEMELLERWLEGTPERLRPVPFDQIVVEGNYFDAVFDLTDEFDAIPLTPKPGFVSKTRYLKVNRNDCFNFASNEHFIKVQGKDYFPYIFLRHGNRKPGDPVCPETWQGWKELEESLTPSTMRDEIRLTRMLIQYCDMNDKNVLDELKEWFANMNELQRMSMAKSFDQRGHKDLESSFNEFYQVIREYDTIPKLQDVGTLDLNYIID